MSYCLDMCYNHCKELMQFHFKKQLIKPTNAIHTLMARWCK